MISIFEVNILHPIIVFSFCDINVDSKGLRFSCNKHSNVFYGFIISSIGGKCFLPFLADEILVYFYVIFLIKFIIIIKKIYIIIIIISERTRNFSVTSTGKIENLHTM